MGHLWESFIFEASGVGLREGWRDNRGRLYTERRIQATRGDD